MYVHHLLVLLLRRIAAAIAEAGLTGQVHPTDYLQFFCLGKREPPPVDQVSMQPVSFSAIVQGLFLLHSCCVRGNHQQCVDMSDSS